MDASNEDEPPRFSALYFGYASNMSPKTLHQRCPDSMFAGLARLDDYRVYISSIGFINIKPSPGDVVYGTLSFLSPSDEAFLDRNEEVPIHNEKRHMKMKRLPSAPGETEKEVTALVYIDLNNLDDGKILSDYVPWVQKAIVQGQACGIPEWYIDKHIKPFVPESAPPLDEINFVRVLARDSY